MVNRSVQLKPEITNVKGQKNFIHWRRTFLIAICVEINACCVEIKKKVASFVEIKEKVTLNDQSFIFVIGGLPLILNLLKRGVNVLLNLLKRGVTVLKYLTVHAATMNFFSADFR